MNKSNMYSKMYRYTEEEDKRLRIISRQDLCKLRRRARGGLTQEEYAEDCGVSLNLIQRLESDRRYDPNWKPDMYIKLLGVTLDFVIDHVVWNTDAGTLAYQIEMETQKMIQKQLEHSLLSR